MRLHEEMRTPDPIFSSHLRLTESAEIAAQTEAFLRKGGKINCVAVNASGLNGGVLMVPECAGAIPLHVNSAALAEKGRKGAPKSKLGADPALHQQSKNIRRGKSGHQNIWLAGENKFLLMVGNDHIGTFDSLDDAIAKRQSVRKARGMSFVSGSR